MSRSNFLPALLGTFLLTVMAIAQQKAEEPAPPKPGPEHARLKKLEGTWDAVVIGQDGKKSKAVMVYKMECGGLWLTSDFKGEMEGQSFEGKGFDTYDPATKKFVGVWVDSMLTSPLRAEGTWDEKTKTATGLGECNGPDGKPMKFRMVTKKIDDDHETFEMYMIAPDRKETKSMTIEYTRRK